MTKRDELIAPGGVGVKVKPLEWNEYTDERGDPDRWDAETLAGTFYGIALLFDGFSIEYDYTAVAKGLDDLEAAKAAAQADYERRILSALEAPAASDGEPVARKRPVAFRVRQHRLSNYYELYTNEKDAQFWADDRGIEYEGLYLVADRFTAPPADAGMREALEKHNVFIASIYDSLSKTRVARDKSSATNLASEALTAPGATTKSDGGLVPATGPVQTGDVLRYEVDEVSRVGEVIEHLRPSDPSSTRSDVTVGISKDTLLSLISALDRATGDTDPSVDPDSTDEEVRREYPVFWVCQQLRALLDQFEIRRRK